MAITGAAAAVIGTAGNLYYQDQAAGAQQEASEERRSINRAQALRERRQQIRQARIARAQAVNTAHTSGGLGSPLSGAMSSIGTQLGSNLGFNEGTLRASEKAGDYDIQASRYGTMSNASGIIAGIGTSIRRSSQYTQAQAAQQQAQVLQGLKVFTPQRYSIPFGS